MHSQAPGCFRDIAVTLFVNALNVLPADAVRCHRELRGWRQQVRRRTAGPLRSRQHPLAWAGSRARPALLRKQPWRCCRNRSRTTTRLLGRASVKAVTTSSPLPSSSLRSTTAKAGGLRDAASLPAMRPCWPSRVRNRAAREHATKRSAKAGVVIDDQQAAIYVALEVPLASVGSMGIKVADIWLISWFSTRSNVPSSGGVAINFHRTKLCRFHSTATDAPPLRRFVKSTVAPVCSSNVRAMNTPKAHAALFSQPAEASVWRGICCRCPGRRVRPGVQCTAAYRNPVHHHGSGS